MPQLEAGNLLEPAQRTGTFDLGPESPSPVHSHARGHPNGSEPSAGSSTDCWRSASSEKGNGH